MKGAVRLRETRDTDLPVFFEHQRDPDANRMAAFPARDEAAFLAHWKRILSDATVRARTIVLEASVAGNVVSFERFGKREVGYWIGREYWGQAVATRALSAFLGEEVVRPLYARVASHNVASLRVLDKCGFTPTVDADGYASAPIDDVEEVLLVLRPSAGDPA